jgi:membrane protease YdiL (CAAX protease family)
LVTGSAWVGFGLAAILFGAAHWYQGWTGVAVTSVMGMLFTALYLASGRLWVAIAFHAFLDLIGLVLRPALTGAWRKA